MMHDSAENSNTCVFKFRKDLECSYFCRAEFILCSTCLKPQDGSNKPCMLYQSKSTLIVQVEILGVFLSIPFICLSSYYYLNNVQSPPLGKHIRTHIRTHIHTHIRTHKCIQLDQHKIIHEMKSGYHVIHTSYLFLHIVLSSSQPNTNNLR